MVLLPEGWAAFGELLVDDNRVYIEQFDINVSQGTRYYLPAARSGIMQNHRIIASSLVKRTTPCRFGTFSRGAHYVRGDSRLYGKDNPL